jgi:hypothetical protein
MSDQPTPRTDAEVAGDPYGRTRQLECVNADFARKLELELAEATATNCALALDNIALRDQVARREALESLKPCAHNCSDGNCPHDRKYRAVLAATKGEK